MLSAVGGLGWIIYLYEPVALRLQSYIVGTGVDLAMCAEARAMTALPWPSPDREDIK